MIYLDNSATTRPKKSVLETYIKVSEIYFGNPSSLHPLGGEAEGLLEQARTQSASLLGVDKNDVIFTSGATEANNTAVKGTAEKFAGRGKHIITTAVEHPSVLEVMDDLEKKGWEITRLMPDIKGEIHPGQVEEALRDDTVLVSCMHVNNETGSIQPVEKIGGILRAYPKVFYHVDHVQGVGRVPLDIAGSRIDLLTISGHKFHGVKGTGILVSRRKEGPLPLFHGGNQENGRRAGTENTAGAAATAKALRLLMGNREETTKKMRSLNLLLEERLAAYRGVDINSPKSRAPHILNFSVAGVKPETIVQALAQKEIFLSTTAACSSKSVSGSRVLAAMPLPEERAETALRISLSEETTGKEIETFLEVWQEVYRNTARKGKHYEI